MYCVSPSNTPPSQLVMSPYPKENVPVPPQIPHPLMYLPTPTQPHERIRTPLHSQYVHTAASPWYTITMSIRVILQYTAAGPRSTDLHV